MKQFYSIIQKAKAQPCHIVLAEGEDSRIIEGAIKAAEERLCRLTLLGNYDRIKLKFPKNIEVPTDISFLDPSQSPDLQLYAELYHELRYHKKISHQQAKVEVLNPVNFANIMVREGSADGSLAGATHRTGDVVKSAIQIIGLKPKHRIASSFFIMMMCEPHHPIQGGVIFTDCGLIISPSAEELSEIAYQAAENARCLLDIIPKIAMLSFATKNSAESEEVEKVRLATKLLKEKHPHLNIDGVLQFDAAIVPEIAASKAPDSSVAGSANIFVFPDLNAGNIGYKIAERLGGLKAIGPILQGLNHPANDLSRGCDSEAVFNMIAVTAAQAHFNTLKNRESSTLMKVHAL